jgi:hypothetical protein
MPRISVQQVGKIGTIKDLAQHLLPLNAWTDSNNVRFIDKKISRWTGYSSVFGTPTVAPQFLIPVPTASQIFWIYTSLIKAYVYDGATHTEITRIASNYTANAGVNWNGGVLGGVLVLNDEADVPQYWPTISTATKLIDLINWPAADRTRILRPFKAFLVAYNYTLAGVAKPHRIRWSHAADPGTVPSSWDITDTTKDAGEVDLTDVQAGQILDAYPLQDYMVVYKNESTWLQRFIGGTSIFKFDNVLVTSGLLTARCCAPIKKGTRHFLHNGYELVEFDGVNPRPVTDDRWARWLRREIDTNNFANCFVFDHPDQNEAWFCYPTAGSTLANKALIWNYEEDTLYVKDFLGVYATRGVVPIPAAELWSTDTSTWDMDTDRWSSIQGSKTVVADPTNTLIYQLESGFTANGTVFNSFVERTGLALSGVDRYGAPVVDIGTRKMIKRLWPKVTGGPINIYFGSQEDLQAPVVWSNPIPFDPASGQQYVDTTVNGRLLGWRFAESNGNDWALEGFEFEMEVLGEH